MNIKTYQQDQPLVPVSPYQLYLDRMPLFCFVLSFLSSDDGVCENRKRKNIEKRLRSMSDLGVGALKYMNRIEMNSAKPQRYTDIPPAFKEHTM